jgi:allantoin racemase
LIVPRRILVINPNSSADVTAAIESGLDGLGLELRFEIACRRLESGPPAIESQADIESVVIPTVELIRAEPAAAYVIACFSREAIQAPVVGIAESAILLALGLGHRFGIIAIRDVSVRRHLRYVRSLGLEGRLAGDRPLNLGVHDAGAAEAIDRIIEVGRELRDRDGADVLILGCAGMGLRRQIIQEALGLPVIDPVQAAVARAASLIALRYPRAA